MLRPSHPRGRHAIFLLLALIGLLITAPVASAPRLHARVSLPSSVGPLLELPDEDRRWLWRRRQLKVAVAGPDAAPWDILGNGQHYEGISAEYLNLLSEALRLDLHVVRFDTRDAAIAALREGQVDLLTASFADEAGTHGLRRSQPYEIDQPVLVKRVEVAPSGASEVDPVLAIREGYATAAGAQALVPGFARWPVPSTLTGLAAVALGQADALLGNAASVAAQLAHSPLYGREQVSFLPPREAGVAFLLRAGDSRLLGMVNSVVAQAPAPWREQVRILWQRGAAYLSEAPPVQLEAPEQGWLAAHPKLRVGYLKAFSPLSFQGDQGEFRGVAADLLARIAQRTGLVVEPVPLDSQAALVAGLTAGTIDLAASMTSDAAAQAGLPLSRAWLSAVPVLVTATASAPMALLAQAQGQRVAIPATLGLASALASRWPSIRWHEYPTAHDALQAVQDQRALGAVLPYIQARALLAGEAGSTLRISGALPITPPRYGFAANAAQMPLLALLDQALLSFEPAGLDDMARRWRSEIHVEPRWPTQARWLVPAFSLAGSMLLLAVVWIRVLRRQVRKRRVAEQALTDQLEFMRVMIDGTPHPVYVRDRDGHLINCNASYLSALGVERTEVIGQTVTRIPLADAQAQEYETLYRSVIASGRPIVEDRQLRLRNGRQLTVFHWMLPYQASNGTIGGLIGGWIDITERQRLYDALQAAKEAADAANRAKTHFLATASHEIRTPMNAVLGMLELALRKAEKGELDRLALRVASDSASGLLELLNDILDISRIESGHLTLNPRPVDVTALAAQVVQLYQPKAREKQLRLVLKTDVVAGRGVLLDPLRFQQVLGNLLSNAIKFTQRGGVSVSLQGIEEGNEMALRLVVTDTGIGIPEDDLRRLCKPYQQAGNHGVSGRVGAGLGLSISQHLCRLMGGGLSLNSREGEGSRVQACFRLPVCELPGALSQALPNQVPLEAMDVLVVDDHEPNRVLLSQQLAYLGHRVTVAVDGAQGLREWCGRGGFDVVICDCEMPGLDGYDLARAIRLEEQRKHLARCRLLACTADAGCGQRERCREAGMDDCLVKPLGLEALAAALAPTVVHGKPDSAPDLGLTTTGHGAQALLGLAGGSPSAARRLRDSLQQALAQDAARLSELPEASPELDAVVHRIKGGARIVGAVPLVEACEAVEAGSVTVSELLAEIETLQTHLRGMRFSLEATTEPEARPGSAPAAQPKPAA
jgi:two-component system sensor histidine kinase EvgS